VNKRNNTKHSARVEYGVVLFRTLCNYIERESNRRESCPPNQCHSAELDGKEVGDDLLYFGVRMLDDVTLGRGPSMRSWPSSSLTDVKCTSRNGKEIGSSSVRPGEGCRLPFDAQLKD
jgi:hypothetical protein